MSGSGSDERAPDGRSPTALGTWGSEHPLLAAVAMGGVGALLYLRGFGDLRAAAAGAAGCAVFAYLWFRPGWLGDKIGAHEQRTFEERGDVGIRRSWVIRLVLIGSAVLAAWFVFLSAFERGQ